MTEQLETRKELEHQIILKSLEDDGFKQELMSNPKAALSRELGLQGLPDSLQINVVEETPNSIYVVLPAKPSKDGELSDQELEAVAGGKGGIVGTLVGSAIKTVQGGIKKCF
jgi:hypothetical protein